MPFFLLFGLNKGTQNKVLLGNLEIERRSPSQERLSTYASDLFYGVGFRDLGLGFSGLESLLKVSGSTALPDSSTSRLKTPPNMGAFTIRDEFWV